MNKEYLVAALLGLIIVCTTILVLYDKLDIAGVETMFMAVITICAGWIGIKVGIRLAR